MKKVVSVLVLASFLLLPLITLADDPEFTPTHVDFVTALNNITNWLFWLLIVIAVIFLIIAALYFVTARGDPDKVKSARDMVLYALIGVLVAVLAKGLVWFIAKIAGQDIPEPM